MKTIQASVFTQVANRVLDCFENIGDATQFLSSSSGLAPDTWGKRLGPGSTSWFRRDITLEQMDEFLAAADATHLWHEPPLAGKARVVRCEDCHVALNPGNYTPIDLFRHQYGASGKWVWDSTKQKWVRRPAQGPKKRARRHGRRFRVYHLCSTCAEKALLERGYDGAKRLEKPKRGGRPRLLNDEELRKLHVIYENSQLSRLEIARRLVESRGGSVSGYDQSMLYGWRRLHLKMYGRAEGLRRAHALKTWTPAKCSHPDCHYFGDLTSGLCKHHQQQEKAA